MPKEQTLQTLDQQAIIPATTATVPEAGQQPTDGKGTITMKKLLKYDPNALDIARAMVAIISPDDAFLFGSRARGDWTNQSDIDVLTIAEQHRETRAKYQQALQTGQAMATEIYGRPVKIDLVRYNLQDFEYYRQARTHLTHSALKEGINMSGEATGYGNQYPDTEPNNWPDIEQRFTNYQRQILAAENNLEAGLGYEEVGFHFQRALENAMKGFLSYMDHEDGQDNAWIRSHSISDLPEVIRTFPEGQAALGTNDFTFLNDYAINIPYEGVQDPLPDEAEVLQRIMETVDNMMRFIEQDSGTELSRYQPPGPRT